MLNVSLRTNNAVILEGRITYLREYSKGKAANITLAVENGKNPDGSDRSASFVQTKSFTPDCYNKLELKMLVRIFGHIVCSHYEKDGEQIFKQDIVADYVEFLETKAAVQARKMAEVND